MRLSLHLLKYELHRLRWVRWLAWLPAAGAVAFFQMPEQEHGSLLYRMDLDDMGWFWSYAVAMLGLMALAAAMAGAKVGENPQKAFAATRPLRRRHVAGAAAMLLALVALPGALAYGGILAVAEFGLETVLAGAAQALGLLWGAGLAVWAWARLWHTFWYLALALIFLPALTPVLLSSAIKDWLPAEHPPVDRLVPLLLIMCLPALITVWLLRKPADERRIGWAIWAWPLVFLLVWSADVAWRRMFPGKLERMVFGSGGAVLTAAELEPEVHDFGPPVKKLLLAVPDHGLSWEGSVASVAWRVRAQVSGPVEPVPEWSDWQQASGSLVAAKGQVFLSYLNFDEQPLAGCTQVDLRFQMKLRLAGLEIVETGVSPGTKANGVGWWVRVDALGNYYKLKAPGLAGAHLSFVRSDWFGVREEDKIQDLPNWLKDLRRGDHKKACGRLAPAMADVYIHRQETCVRVVQVDGVKMVPHSTPEPAVDKPRPPTEPAREKPAPPPPREPFEQDQSFRAWLADAEAVPTPDAGDAEVAYFAQSLHDGPHTKVDSAVISLVRAQPGRFLEMAVMRELRQRQVKAVHVAIRYPSTGAARPAPRPARRSGPGYVEVAGAFELALIAGIPESLCDEVCRRLWEAPWLVSIVESRCWGEAARPWLLRSAAAGKKPIPRELLKLIRGYEDPGFNDAMRCSFALDLPTVDYWASMPGLTEELESMLAKNWNPDRNYWSSNEEPKALLAAGFRPYLDWLLKKSAERNPRREILEALRDSVLDAAGNPPPWPTPAAGSRPRSLAAAPQAFLDWCRGLTVEDFTFDRQRRRFVRKPLTTPPP